MTTATEIIAYLLPRRPKPVVERTTGLPHGWGIWLRNAPQRHGQLTYAPIDALVAELARRPHKPPAKVAPMTRWRALRSLLWQHWDPPPREERGTRWLGGLGSLLLHLGFFALLLLVSLITMPAPPDEEDGTRVQLTLIGRGTQGEGGGAGPQTPDTGAQAAAPSQPSKTTSPARRTPSASAAQAEATAAKPAEAPPATPPPPQVAQQPAQPAPAAAPEPQPTPTPTPPVEQPLQVTETSQPTQDFVVPPVTPPQIQLQSPTIQMPQTAARVREVEVVQSQQPVAVQQVAPRPMDLPATAAAQPQVRQRDIPMPEEVQTVQAPALQAVRPSTTPSEVQLREATPAQARQREIPMPSAPASEAATASAANPAQTSEAASSASSASNTATTKAEQGQSTQASSSSANTGAPPSPVSGGQTAGSLANARGAGAKPSDDWGTPGPKTADDWGASNKASPGNQAGAGEGLKGLFNADGSTKLPGDTAAGSTVKPGVPGSRQQAKFDADRAGKWLERPAFGYEPTMFDRYWIPGGTLLQDWVRAGVSEMEIPIPGTSKRIRCVVSVLQAGGACGLFDPNKNNQPATARPPPDIPVKRTPIPEGS
ncbi:hypothetical protein SAMN05428989_2871 [Pseudoxanthomonas sp. GM95]|uniref:hypothetical protein n=1 Tax=Pseudoxanthomonas sp. GM95 TaxID=1881043 RepID=UPI0008C47B52|nr:hypothetical protein [Pseudoxanthomonas sp. GM95]SEL91511.1 hypothetical protein SAMN05428989_2871 [Pseudoxanthomonas sp. GM95]